LLSGWRLRYRPAPEDDRRPTTLVGLGSVFPANGATHQPGLSAGSWSGCRTRGRCCAGCGRQRIGPRSFFAIEGAPCELRHNRRFLVAPTIPPIRGDAMWRAKCDLQRASWRYRGSRCWPPPLSPRRSTSTLGK
jgi:hypothetical protein